MDTISSSCLIVQSRCTCLAAAAFYGCDCCCCGLHGVCMQVDKAAYSREQSSSDSVQHKEADSFIMVDFEKIVRLPAAHCAITLAGMKNTKSET